MPQFSENKYLQSLLENLVTSYETEINYNPIVIELDSQHITPTDSDTLIKFVSEQRKRLFIFKISEDPLESEKLAFIARRSVLNATANTILQNTSSEPKIYPLKALNTTNSLVRARIQIQKSFTLPKPIDIKKESHSLQEEPITTTDPVLKPIDLPELPELTKQLKALRIEYLEESALSEIKNHSYAFGDGIIPNNLPKGFYINIQKQALCYTNTPNKLPSALAPILKREEPFVLPSVERVATLLPTLPQTVLSQLMETEYSLAQKNLLMSQFPTHQEEFKTLSRLLKTNLPTTWKKNQELIILILCKQFILGGEAHTILLLRLINTCLNKKINLEFLINPEVQNSLLSTRGIKNLQKLVQLPAEQKEWWNTLVNAHQSYNKESFDFNTFFEAYTQIFLPQIAEKNITLPNPCPIDHNGHLLITLNRILDVITHATNPQEQCLSLANLDWGSTGAHYAMLQQPEPEQFKQVTSCMRIENPEDTITNPELIYSELENEQLELKPWLFRYMGKHWKTEIRLNNIQSQLFEIENLTWTQVQKNQLTFILTCTFADKGLLSQDQWKKTLLKCIASLQQLDENDRCDLLKALSRCFKFKPNPSLGQINTLLDHFIECKNLFPSKNFKEELLTPLVSCLEKEGFELLSTIQERIEKTDPNPEVNQFSLSVITSFMVLLAHNRDNLFPNLIKVLAKLNEPELSQTGIDEILAEFQNLRVKKGVVFFQLAVHTLCQINSAKSQVLPTKDQIKTLIGTLANSIDNLPIECNTTEKQETWLKDFIIDKNLLPGCVLGNGDISKLDDLIVDALVNAIKTRSAAFKVDSLKKVLQKNLESHLVPQQLRDQLNKELMPLFDAVNDLVNLLQTPNPKFPEVIAKLKFFEDKKPTLLQGIYSLIILGNTKGEYILSFLLTGKRKATDNLTGSAFAAILGKLHGLFISEMTSFFGNPQNKLLIKDLDINTALSWMAAFNDTHSLTFFFKEELIQKKVIPALKKTLQQLNTQDSIFEKSILDEASSLNEEESSDKCLQDYKEKIESIANYLNLLIDINDRLPSQFKRIYKQLNIGPLARLNYIQKHILINKLITDHSEQLDLYLKLITQALEEYPNADSSAIERAINGLIEVFKLSDLEQETQIMFFKMSMVHNLTSSNPFPLTTLNEFKKSTLAEETKALIIKQIIHILLGLSGTDSSELIQGVVQQTQSFLTLNQDQSNLCIALLKKISKETSHQDLSAYPLILQQLAQINPEKRKKIAIIINELANNKKDDTVNLFALLEVIKGLGRRSTVDIDQVLQLFTTSPYPNTQSLNTALLAHDSEKLRDYCLHFDTNPFAKTGEKRDLAKQFATNRVKEALLSLHDLIDEVDLPHSLQMKLAKQLTFIETIGYTDPLNPNDFNSLQKLTASSRDDLKTEVGKLLQQLRSKSIPSDQTEITYLKLIAYFREIYFRTTGLFPNTTQILVLLLALHDPASNLLMRIKTGEGKSISAPMLSALQWAQGGTVDQCTANPTLLLRDYENNCEPFYKFLGIKSALIQSDTDPEAYQLGGINCSTVEDMSLFRLAAKEAKKEKLLENDSPLHIALDECDDALLDETTLYKLVAKTEQVENNPAEWIYPLAYEFINLPAFRNIDSTKGKVWDEDEDLEQFRLFLNKEINDQFNGDIEKQNYLLASSNTQLKQWIHASCMASTLVENKHFILQPLKEKDESGQEITKKIICVPLIRSTPKAESIFTEAVQQALQARLKAERNDLAHYFIIDPVPSVLSSQSSHGLIKFYHNTQGRILGISATPGDQQELESLATSLGTQAISVAPYAGDNRKNHAPIFTSNREESIKVIGNILDQIKCPITKPIMEINPDMTIQTLAEHENLIAQSKSAIAKWSQTQTQPILIINEAFDEAQAIGNRLKTYAEQGFKIQIITGKESPMELDRIIKQAGQVNTITVGTAMLAKGIDINTGEHPKGLLVIQTYPDTERMSTQIAGRAARNGKPGEWLPIYQIKPPQDLINKIIYTIFPWRRQSINEHTVGILRNKIKLQATVDRLYSQAIDEAQQILMQQIEAWESLLFDLYPEDAKIQFEFYQWRETLLGELTRSQETNVSESTLKTNIDQFKKSASKLWETAREEKWAAKAEKAAYISQEQNLRLNYLKQIDFFEELNIQSPLQKKNKQFTTATKRLMQQNLETTLANKAGIVLEYTKPTGQLEKELQLAQSKQILPTWIGEFCTVYPEAISTLFPKNSSQNAFYIPEIINIMVNKFIEQKNKILYNEEKEQLTQIIIQSCQKELANADSITITNLLLKIKPLMLQYSSDLTKLPLVEQFKMQGLILGFCTLYQNLELPQDNYLNKLQISYHNEIMKKLAEHLLRQLAWTQERPEPLHVFFERTAAKESSLAIYNLAKDVFSSPQDKDKIQALYAGLKKHKGILSDNFLFSIRHASPRNVIQDALNAIDALNEAPHCDINFRNECHDKVISDHELTLFRNFLTGTSPYFFKTYDPIWDHLKNTLLNISTSSPNNPGHIIQELYEATERFSTYEDYKPYLKVIKALKKHLQSSIKKLNQTDGLKKNPLESLFAEKKAQFATLFKVMPEQVQIQKETDGLQSYIKLQVDGELEPSLNGEFTKHKSSFLERIKRERSELLIFEENKYKLLELSDINALSILPDAKYEEFSKLFRLKAILDKDWNHLDSERNELPDLIKKRLQQIDALKRLDWKSQPVDLIQLKITLDSETDEPFVEMIQIQAEITKDLNNIQEKIENINSQIRTQKKDIAEIEQIIKEAQNRREQSDCGFMEKASLFSQIIFQKSRLTYLKNQLAQLSEKLESWKEEEREAQDGLCNQNQKIDDQIKNLITQAKHELSTYLQENTQQQVDAREKEIKAIERTLNDIEQTELTKSRYQTRTFFTPKDLLKYQAELSHEEAMIKKTTLKAQTFEPLLDEFKVEHQSSLFGHYSDNLNLDI